MQQLTRFSGFIAKRGVAATAAAVLMVGGGVAVAQTTASNDTAPNNEFGLETAHDAIEDKGLGIEALCEEAPDAPFCPEPSERADDVESDGTDEVVIEEVEPLDEEDPTDVPEPQLLENAADFSVWVRSIPSDLGCIRGHLVSAAAQAGPLSDEFVDLDLTDVDAVEEWAEDQGLEGRCVEVALERAGSDAVQTTDAEATVEQSGPPADAGPPADLGPSEHAGPPNESNADEGAGPPADAGPPSDPPEDAGPPADAGASAERGR